MVILYTFSPSRGDRVQWYAKTNYGHSAPYRLGSIASKDTQRQIMVILRLVSNRRNEFDSISMMCRPRLFRFFRRFPQINVGGDSARIPFLGDASRESRVALPPKEPARSNPIVLLHSPSALSSSLSQTGLRFHDCNHIVEFVFVKFVSTTYRLRSKKTMKGKGGKRVLDPSTKQIALLSFLFLQGSSIHHISISELWSTAHHFLALNATSIFQVVRATQRDSCSCFLSNFSCSVNCLCIEFSSSLFKSDSSFVTFLNVSQQTSSSSLMKNSSSSSTQRKCAFARKCARLVKEQRARFYIIRRCVIMLICWHEYNDS
ncbi:hypothetical protein D0Y65_041470 [Glycine soja]|uniref:Uncharacterized protein n=1 Tax=Glycine soja TaxID=3848 RepID=A0A445GW28_GLYSO|nr:hypothetical protein D0Y65_041470 [Glycine soja]